MKVKVLSSPSGKPVISKNEIQKCGRALLFCYQVYAEKNVQYWHSFTDSLPKLGDRKKWTGDSLLGGQQRPVSLKGAGIQNR